MESKIQTQDGGNAATVDRIHILEGLRAYMAWWVVLGHCLVECGFEPGFMPGLLKIVCLPGYAVDVFVILSGFVITNLLAQRRTNYGEFILRRFFRIYPLYIVTVLIGLFTLHTVGPILSQFSNLVHSDSVLVAMWPEYEKNTLLYFLSNLTLLHGMVPQSWLPHAQAAFVSQAWSISLEWQFYLVVPFIFWGFKRWPLPTLAGVLVLVWGRGYYPPIGDWGSFLPEHAEYFAIGIVSYFAYRRLTELKVTQKYPGTAWIMLLFLIMTTVPECRHLVVKPFDLQVGEWLPLSVWLVVFALLVDYRCNPNSRVVRVGTWLFLNPVAQYLGKVSFSTYLWHYFVIYFCMWAALALKLPPGKYYAFALTVSITIPLTLLISHFSYKFVELNGIALGKYCQLRMKKRATGEAVAVPSS